MDVVRSSMKLFFANITKTFVGFVAITLFARELGASGIGTFFLFQAVLVMLSLPADFGIRTAMEKRISEGKNERNVLATGLALKAIPIGCIVLGVVAFEEPINHSLGEPLADYLVVGLVVWELANVGLNVLKGELRVEETATLWVVYQFIWFGVGGLLIVAGLAVEALVLGLIFGYFVIFLWSFWKIDTRLGRPTKDCARSLWSFTKYNVVSQIGGQAYSWVDIAFIGYFLTSADVGVYEIAWLVSSIVLLFNNAISETIFPKVSMWDTNDRTNEIEVLIGQLFTPSIVLVLPMFFGSFVLSRDVLRLIFGPEFAVAWLVLIILIGDKIFQSVHIIFGRFLTATDNPNLPARANLVTLPANVVLNVLFIPRFRIEGAALATLLSFGLNTGLHLYYLSGIVRIRIPYREIGWCTFASVTMAIAVWAVRAVVEVDSVPVLILLILWGTIVYFGIVLVFDPIRERLRTNLHRILPQVGF
jgi:O-antigen/teichoic acid export membrane protein